MRHASRAQTQSPGRAADFAVIAQAHALISIAGSLAALVSLMIPTEESDGVES